MKFTSYTPESLRYEMSGLRRRLTRNLSRRERKMAQRDLGKCRMALADWGL